MTFYHFDMVFLITVSVFRTHFSYRNSEKHHYEKNSIYKLAPFEKLWGDIIINANFCVI